MTFLGKINSFILINFSFQVIDYPNEGRVIFSTQVDYNDLYCIIKNSLFILNLEFLKS